ncbi:hypothetical protein GQL56_00325 [Pseudomonas putida]|nr:hypothetical protein [Pseudomonas putida]
MAGFTDFFTAENMNSLMQDPRMVLGLQMLAQGRQGSSSQAIGQAGSQAAQILQQNQHSQALQQYRSQMAAMQQQQMQMQQAKAHQQAEQQAQYQQRLQDPGFLDNLSPTARQMAGLGVEPSDLIRAIGVDNLAQHRDASLAQQQGQFESRQAHQGSSGGSSGPRMPTQRQVLDEPLGNGMMQRHVLNPQTGQYQPYGEPFNQYSPGRKAKAENGADAATEAIMGAEPTAAELPGNAPLASYAPQPQQPIGVMAANGGGAANPVAQSRAGNRAPGQPQIARPMTKAAYDALPVGTAYIDPVSGKTATKRG